MNPLLFEYGQPDEYFEPNREYYHAVVEDSTNISYFNSDSAVFHTRGRMISGEINDGVISHLLYDPYTVIASTVPGTSFTLGSKYPSNGPILIYPTVDSQYDALRISFGSGFQEIQAIDVDGNGCDEAVKVNLLQASNDSTYLAITVYRFAFNEVSPAFQVDSSRFIIGMKGRYWNGTIHGPARMKFFYGDFTGVGKVQIMIVNDNMSGSNNATRVLNLDDGSLAYDGYTISPQFVLCRDIDADGQTEICQATESVFEINRFIGGIFTKVGTSAFPREQSLAEMIAVGDLNADGYTDILSASSQKPGLYCFRYNGSTFDSLCISTIYQRSPDDQNQLVDINHDGYDDLVFKRADQVIIALNDLGAFSPCRTVMIPTGTTTDVLPGNVVTGGSTGFLLTFEGSLVRRYAFPQANRSFLRQLTMNRNSLGNVQRNIYRNLPDHIEWNSVYYQDANRHYSLEDGYFKQIFNMNVLAIEEHYPFDNQIINQHRQYIYYDAAFNQRGLGFCGFGKIITDDYSDIDLLEEDPIIYYTTTVYDPENSGVVKSVTRKTRSDSWGPRIDSTSYRYSKVTHPYRKQLPRLDTIVMLNDTRDIKTITRYRYDDYDYVISKETLVLATDTLSGYNRASNTYTVSQYVHQQCDADSLWMLGNPINQITTRFNDLSERGWEERQESTYLYRSNRPDTIRQYIGYVDYQEGPYEAENLLSEVHYTYDTLGNVTSEQTASYGGTTFHGSTYTYDAQGRFLLSETDAAGLTASYSGYNIFGKPTTVTDPRGNVTSYTYDNWGNLTSVIHPDGSTENTSRQWAVDEDFGSLYKITVSGNASPT